jgi:hypothetical protein
MYYGLSLIERDIAAHPDHFVLAIDGDLLVHFALGIEPSQRRSIQRSDSGEATKQYAVIFYQGDEAFSGLLEFADKYHVTSAHFTRVKQFDLHLGSLPLGTACSGATYSLAVSRGCPVAVAIAIKDNT